MKQKIIWIISIVLISSLPIHFGTASAQTEPPSLESAQSWTGDVQGQIKNASPDGQVPGLLELMLHGWDGNNGNRLMLHGKSDLSGKFVFEDVTLELGNTYAIMVSNEGANYLSEPQTFVEGQQSYQFEVTIFDKTSDRSVARVDQSHWILAFDDGIVHVTEVYLISNLSDYPLQDAVQLADGSFATFEFSLPADAGNVTFPQDGNGRFIQIPEGFADTAALIPGEVSSQVVVQYILPYSDGMSLEYSALANTGSVNFILPKSSGVLIEGEKITAPRIQTIREGEEYLVYATGALSANETVKLNLTGEIDIAAVARPVMGEAGANENAGAQSAVGLGGLMLGASLVLVGIWWWRKPEAEPPLDAEQYSEDFDQILGNIITLEQSFQRGELPEKEYHQRRAALRQIAKATLPD